MIVSEKGLEAWVGTNSEKTQSIGVPCGRNRQCRGLGLTRVECAPASEDSHINLYTRKVSALGLL